VVNAITNLPFEDNVLHHPCLEKVGQLTHQEFHAVWIWRHLQGQQWTLATVNQQTESWWFSPYFAGKKPSFVNPSIFGRGWAQVRSRLRRTWCL
jgi:hypothetical protein